MKFSSLEARLWRSTWLSWNRSFGRRTTSDINSIGVELRLVNADLEIRQKDLRMWPLAKDFQEDAVEATTLIGLERTSAFLLHPIPDAEGCQTTL